MTEQALWCWLRDGLQGRPNAHVQRIEGAPIRGVPDVEGCVRGCAFWLELKACTASSRVSSMLRYESLKSAQRRWMHARRMAGGRVGVLLAVGVTRWWIPASQVLSMPRSLTWQEVQSRGVQVLSVDHLLEVIGETG